MIDRRSFLAGAAALALGAPARAAASPLLLRPIPASGEQLPVIGLGTADSFDVGDSLADRAPLLEVLRAFHDGGARLVDTAPSYRRAEPVLGDLLADLGLARDCFVATKVGTSGRDAGRAQLAASFERLRKRPLDLVQVHNLSDWQEQHALLAEARAGGAIRYTGLTHFRVEAYAALEAALRSSRCAFAQFNYSIVTRDAERRLLPACQDLGIAVIVNRAFEDGQLFATVRDRPLPGYAAELGIASWAQFFLKFVLSHPAVTCVIPATSKVRHLRDNLAAGAGPLPDAALRERMARELA